MQYRRTLAWMTLLLVVALALAGCAPRVGAGDTVKSAAPDALVVDMPAIALDVAEDGSLSFGGVPVSELGGSLGLPAGAAALPPDVVKMLTAAGIQHIQLNNEPNGLAILINGQTIPSLGWTPDQLKTLGSMMDTMPAVAKLLPALTQLGVGITLRLPVAEGATKLPLQAEAEGSAAATLAEGQKAFLTDVQTQPTVVVPLNFNEDGTFNVGGTMTSDDLIAMSGQDILKKLVHTPKQMAFIKAAGIKQLGAEVDQDGIHLSVNGVSLPSIDWSGGRLASVIALAQASGMLNLPGMDAAQVQSLIDTYLPMLTSSDIKIEANYP